MRTVTRNVENHIHKHKLTNAYFGFKTQDSCVVWMFIYNMRNIPTCLLA